MNVRDFDPEKSALAFFEILNGYVAEPESCKPGVALDCRSFSPKAITVRMAQPRR